MATTTRDSRQCGLPPAAAFAQAYAADRRVARRREEAGRLLAAHQGDRRPVDDPAPQRRLQHLARDGQVARARHAREPARGREPAHLRGGVDDGRPGRFEVRADPGHQLFQGLQAARPEDVHMPRLRYSRPGIPCGPSVTASRSTTVTCSNRRASAWAASNPDTPAPTTTAWPVSSTAIAYPLLR